MYPNTFSRTDNGYHRCHNIRCFNDSIPAANAGIHGPWKKKCGPNEVWVITGRKRYVQNPDGSRFIVGFRILKGGRSFIWPIIERAERMSLEPMPVDGTISGVNTSDGKRVDLDFISVVRIVHSDVGVVTAAQNLLSKSPDEIKEIIRNGIEAAVRNISESTRSSEMYDDRTGFRTRVQEEMAGILGKSGLEIVSFAVRDIHGKTG